MMDAVVIAVRVVFEMIGAGVLYGIGFWIATAVFFLLILRALLAVLVR